MKTTRLLPVAALIIATLPALAATTPDAPHIVVNGVGEVEMIPDKVIVNVSVEHKADTLLAAKQQADNDITRLIAAASESGVADDDIDASTIQAFPEFNDDDGQSIHAGYRVTRYLELTLRDVNGYATLMENLAANGISRIDSTRFEFSEANAVEDEALKQALKDARRRAEALAAALDSEIGDVYRISNRGGSANPQPRYPLQALMVTADAATPPSASLQVAKRTISRQVEVVFYLND